MQDISQNKNVAQTFRPLWPFGANEILKCVWLLKEIRFSLNFPEIWADYKDVYKIWWEPAILIMKTLKMHLIMGLLAWKYAWYVLSEYM